MRPEIVSRHHPPSQEWQRSTLPPCLARHTGLIQCPWEARLLQGPSGPVCSSLAFRRARCKAQGVGARCRLGAPVEHAGSLGTAWIVPSTHRARALYESVSCDGKRGRFIEPDPVVDGKCQAIRQAVVREGNQPCCLISKPTVQRKFTTAHALTRPGWTRPLGKRPLAPTRPHASGLDAS